MNLLILAAQSAVAVICVLIAKQTGVRAAPLTLSLRTRGLSAGSSGSPPPQLG